MRKLRKIIRIAAIILIALSIIGVVFLILDENSTYATTYEIIAFSVGMAGMLLSIFSQVDATKQENTIVKMNRDLNELIAESEEQNSSDDTIKSKLNHLIALNQQKQRRKPKKPHKN